METKPAVNPANVAKETVTRRRIPMSVPQRKLEVAEIPNYHTHWFRDDNIERAKQAGYEFCEDREVSLNQHNVGSSKDIGGNADMGTRVRVVAGAGAEGKAEYLTLMKIKNEWYDEDRKALEARNASVMSAIFQNEQIPGSDQVSLEDRGQRYVKTALFQRPTRKGK